MQPTPLTPPEPTIIELTAATTEPAVTGPTPGGATSAPATSAVSTSATATPATATTATAADAATTGTTGVPAAQRGSTGTVRDRVGDLADGVGEALSGAGDAVGGMVERTAGATREAVSQVAERIRNTATLPAQRGSTSIGNEVVEKIAGIAARDVPGVYDLGGDVARVFAAVKDRLHLGDEDQGQGIRVKLDGRTAEIAITIVIEFGFVVSSVTDKVREKVISAVEGMLGLDVGEVDILVDDVHIDESGPVGDDAARAPGYVATTEAITVG